MLDELAPPDELVLDELAPPDELVLDELLLDELAPPDELVLDELPTDEPPLPDPVELEVLPPEEPLVVPPPLPPVSDDGLGGTKLVSQPTEGAIVAHAPVNAIPSHAKESKDRSVMDLSFPSANRPARVGTDRHDHGAMGIARRPRRSLPQRHP